MKTVFDYQSSQDIFAYDKKHVAPGDAFRDHSTSHAAPSAVQLPLPRDTDADGVAEIPRPSSHPGGSLD